MGHFVMHQMQHAGFPGHDLMAAFWIGVVGLVMVYVGRIKG